MSDEGNERAKQELLQIAQEANELSNVVAQLATNAAAWNPSLAVTLGLASRNLSHAARKAADASDAVAQAGSIDAGMARAGGAQASAGGHRADAADAVAGEDDWNPTKGTTSNTSG